MSQSGNKHGVGPIRRISNAFFYSLSGLKACYKTEQAFRQELFLFIILCPIPFFLNIASPSKALLVFSLFLVLIAELVNSAIEALADRISTEQHELIKKAKDIGSAMVLVSILAAILIWLIVLFGL